MTSLPGSENSIDLMSSFRTTKMEARAGVSFSCMEAASGSNMRRHSPETNPHDRAGERRSSRWVYDFAAAVVQVTITLKSNPLRSSGAKRRRPGRAASRAALKSNGTNRIETATRAGNDQWLKLHRNSASEKRR